MTIWWMYFDVYFNPLHGSGFSFPPHTRKDYIQEFRHGFYLTPQPDKDCVIHSEHSPSSFHSQKSSFQDMSYQQFLPSCHKGCQLLWHSITPSAPAIAKVPRRGMVGHSNLPLIGWFGLVKRAGFAAWNEMLSASDRDHDNGATGLALSYTFQFSRYRKKLCVRVHVCYT